jgi:hypothetical protein
VKPWAVDIKNAQAKTVLAFPYYLPRGTMPPYPGFEVLEQWLDMFGPECQYQRQLVNGTSALEITFADPEDCFMFVLTSGQPKL